jgi:hypothetical protein
MAKIEFENKTSLRNSDLPEINKLTAGNINEIKASVNYLYDNPEAGYTKTVVTITPTEISYSDGRPTINSGFLSLGDPQQLLPNSGSFKYKDIEKIICEYEGNGIAYSTDHLEIFYTSTGNRYALIGAGLFSTVSGVAIYGIDNGVNSNIQRFDDSLSIREVNGDHPTNGNGILKLIIFHKTPTFGQ